MKEKKHKGLKIFLFILLGIIIIIAALVGGYAINNLTFDNRQLKSAKRAGFEEKQVTLSDGSLINYAEGGSADNPSLMLIHGQTMCWEDYSTVLAKLSKSWHVYALDCTGHGKSVHNAELYTCAKTGDVFISFIDEVIGEKCVVSGHSSGGILAAYIAANAPESVMGAVLEDPPFFSVRPDEMQNTFVWKDGFEIMAKFAEQSEYNNYLPYYYAHSYMWTQMGGLADKFAADAEKQVEADPESYRVKFWYAPHGWTHGTYYYSDFDMAFGMAFYNDTWLEDGQQEEILRGIKCPTIYLKAETSYGADGVLYAANEDADAEKMLELIDNCEMIKIKSGHDIHYEKPKEFVAAFDMMKEKI